MTDEQYAAVARHDSGETPMSEYAYKRKYGPGRRYDRFAPESGPSSVDVRFRVDYVRFTSRSRLYLMVSPKVRS